MKCPKCKNENYVKNGMVKERQRYKCKVCNFNYTVEFKSTAKDETTKRFSLMLYLEGLGFNSIGRLLKVSHVSVMNWIKKYGKQLEELKNNKPIEIVELDEMHTYLKSKKTIVGFGLQLIEMEKSSLISLREAGERKPEKNYGRTLKKMLKEK